MKVGQSSRHLAAFLLDIVKAARDRSAFSAIQQGRFLGNQSLFERIETGLIKGAPAEGVARFNDLVETFAFAFAHDDAFFRPQI